MESIIEKLKRLEVFYTSKKEEMHDDAVRWHDSPRERASWCSGSSLVYGEVARDMNNLIEEITIEEIKCNKN